MEHEGQKGDYISLATSSGPVTLAFSRIGDSYYVISNDFHNRWSSEILRKGAAEFTVGGLRRSGSAKLVASDSEKEEILGEFRNKYGDGYMDRYFRDPNRFISLSGNQEADSGRDNYFEWIESEFDSIASHYDRHIFGNRVNTLLRDRSVAVMTEAFRAKKRLLEIGCGTGTETMRLLSEGHEITATDISSSMLEIVREKAKKEGLSELLTTHRLKASEIGDLCKDSVDRYGGVYSTYGALNCEKSIRGIPESVSSLLDEGGLFVAGVYNRFCLSEMALYALSMQPGKFRDRARKFAPEGHSRFCVDVYAYSTGEFLSYFKELFSLRSLEAVPIIIPPSNLVSYVEKFSRHFPLLDRIDLKLGRMWPFRHLGDHFLCVLEKKKLPGA